VELMLQEREAPGVDGVSLGAVDIKVDGVGLRLRDDAECSLHDLVTYGANLGMPGSTASGDAIPAPRSSGAMGLGAVRLPLLVARSPPDGLGE
jgi:hypothetical protein